MFRSSTAARIVRVLLVAVAASLFAGSPYAGLGLIVAQAVTPTVAALGIGLAVPLLYLLEGRDEAFLRALVASRAFILSVWIIAFTVLWLITLAATPQAYEFAAASCNAAFVIGMLGYRRWKARSFWPTSSDEGYAKLSASLDEVVAALKVLFPKAEARAS